MAQNQQLTPTQLGYQNLFNEARRTGRFIKVKQKPNGEVRPPSKGWVQLGSGPKKFWKDVEKNAMKRLDLVYSVNTLLSGNPGAIEGALKSWLGWNNQQVAQEFATGLITKDNYNTTMAAKYKELTEYEYDTTPDRKGAPRGPVISLQQMKLMGELAKKGLTVGYTVHTGAVQASQPQVSPGRRGFRRGPMTMQQYIDTHPGELIDVTGATPSTDFTGGVLNVNPSTTFKTVRPFKYDKLLALTQKSLKQNYPGTKLISAPSGPGMQWAAMGLGKPWPAQPQLVSLFSVKGQLESQLRAEGAQAGTPATAPQQPFNIAGPAPLPISANVLSPVIQRPVFGTLLAPQPPALGVQQGLQEAQFQGQTFGAPAVTPFATVAPPLPVQGTRLMSAPQVPFTAPVSTSPPPLPTAPIGSRLILAPAVPQSAPLVSTGLELQPTMSAPALSGLTGAGSAMGVQGRPPSPTVSGITGSPRNLVPLSGQNLSPGRVPVLTASSSPQRYIP